MSQKKTRRLKVINDRLEKLQSDFPDVDFKNIDIKRAYDKHFELIKEKIHLEVDLKYCSSENRKEMCSDCNCWKAVANRCS